MRKAKIGLALCIISGLLAWGLYFLIMHSELVIESSLSGSFVFLREFRFCGLYYPLMLLLDAVMLMIVIMKAHKLKSNWLHAPKDSDVIQLGFFGKLLVRGFAEAFVCLIYAALNIMFALEMKKIWEVDIIVPILCSKGLFFAGVYLLQALFLPLQSKFMFGKGTLCAQLLLLAALVLLAVHTNVTYDIVSKQRYMDLNFTIKIYYEFSTGREWPESRFWMTNAIMIGINCFIPFIRLIGLMLYNTKIKMRLK